MTDQDITNIKDAIASILDALNQMNPDKVVSAEERGIYRQALRDASEALRRTHSTAVRR